MKEYGINLNGEEKIEPSTDSNIQIFDDIIPFHVRINFYQRIQNSSFRICGQESIEGARSAIKCVGLNFEGEEFEKFKLWEYLQHHPIMGPIIEPYRVSKAVVNLTRSCDTHFIHTHPTKKVLLYYVNTFWEPGWEGETFFYDKNNLNISYVSAYTPGRLILFDGSTPHSIRSQSIIGPQFRFTLGVLLD